MAPREWTNSIELGPIVREFHTTAEAVVDDGVELVGKAADRAVPVRTGKTKREQVRGRRGLKGHVAYPSKRALALHENLTDRHKGGKRAKFLETSLASSAATIRARALARFRQATGG